MTERKHNRPRKVVDYSKFISQDSDDDDFSDHSYTRTAKKTKLLNSDVKPPKDTRLSNGINQESPVQNKHANRNKVEEETHNIGKENANLQVSSILRTPERKIPIVEDALPTKKLPKIVPVIDTDDSKSSTIVENRVKGSINTLEKFAVQKETIEAAVNIGQNRIELIHSEEESSPGKLDISKEVSDVPMISCLVNMPQPSIVGRQSAMPKWKAPGPACQNFIKSGNEGCSKSFMGLRLGLSRNTRVKPLHANVKVQL